jgi:putative transposase
MVALGIEISGKKKALRLWQSATKNTKVVNELVKDLVVCGLDSRRRYLFVIDGEKALRAGIERVFGERAKVQQSQIHKRRTGKDRLPKNPQGDYDRRIRNAFAMMNYAEANVEKTLRQLERINPIESCLSTVEGVAWNVKRCRDDDQPLRWTAAGLLETERKFHNVKGFRELVMLLRTLNPSLTLQVQVA